jgi:Anthrone oxygenase
MIQSGLIDIATAKFLPEISLWRNSHKKIAILIYVEIIQELAKLLSTLCCGLFAGAAIYVNLVEHPARMKCGVQFAVKEFAPSYHRATAMQVPLAAIGFVCSVVAWLTGAKFWWLIAGVLLIMVIPFTLIFIFPVNKQLVSPNVSNDPTRAQQLLSQWNRLHAVRSALSTIALIITLLNSYVL